MRFAERSCLALVVILSSCAQPQTDAGQCTALDGGLVSGCGGSRDLTDGADAAPAEPCTVDESDAGMVVTCGASTITIPGGEVDGGAAGSAGDAGDLPGDGSVIEGNVTVENSLDIERLERTGATRITGALIIGASPSGVVAGNGLADLSGLHNLTHVGGTLVISFSGTTLHGLEQLTSVGGLDIVSNPNLTDISALAGLTTVLDRVRLNDNPALAQISFALLESVGAVEITHHLGLTSLSFPLLQALSPTAGMVVAAAPALTALELPSLASAGSALVLQDLTSLASVSLPELVSIADSDGAGLRLDGLSVTAVSLPKLASVGGEVELRDNAALASLSLPVLAVVSDGLRVDSNASLTEISLPELTSAGNVTVRANAALASVSMPLLASATEYHVDACPELESLGLPLLGGGSCFRAHDNASLPQCAVDAIEAQLVSNSCAGQSVNNDADAECP